MTTTISPPIRILALVGVVAAIALGAFFVMHRGSSNSATALPPSSTTTGKQLTSTAAAKPAKPAKPKIVLLSGLPRPVFRALHFSNVVVVALYTNGAVGDEALVAEAHKGAKAVHAGFSAINVAPEWSAKTMSAFAGDTTAPPEILVVKRPGKIVNRFDGFVDSQIVAQAARNAGAR